MNQVVDWERFHAMPLVGILRHQGALDHAALVDALVAAGLTTLEVSFTFSTAATDLEKIVAAAGSRLLVGAGTITSVERLAQARAAGASFIVTPALVPEIVERCVADQLPVFPGAYTPTEILEAHRRGAAIVKLFPAVSAGPLFLRQFKGAIPEVRLLPTGGIELADVPVWKRAGADGLGLGGGLFPAALLRAGAWSELQQHVAQYVEAWRSS